MLPVDLVGKLSADTDEYQGVLLLFAMVTVATNNRIQ